MSVEAMAVVLHHSRAEGTTLNVLIGIANHYGDGGAWPSVSTLAKYGRCTERNVRKVLERLITLGEVAVHVQAGGLPAMKDWNRPNRYDILLSCPATCDRTVNHRPLKLPRAQGDLWIDGGSDVTSPVSTDLGGRSAGTGGGRSAGTSEPSLEPSLNSGPVPTEPQTACSICSLARSACESRSRISGHTYAPKAAS